MKVQGRCPMGCGETLMLGDGGYVTCSWIRCEDPCRAHDMLATSDMHVDEQAGVNQVCLEVEEELIWL